MELDDSLLNLFLSEHPLETTQLLSTGVPEGQTFLSALETLVRQSQERKYRQESEDEYKVAMEQDKLLFECKTAHEQILQNPLCLTRADITVLRLKRLGGLKPDEEGIANDLLEKSNFVDLYESLKTMKVTRAYLESAQVYLTYIQKIKK